MSFEDEIMRNIFEFIKPEFYDLRPPPAFVCHFDRPVESVDIQKYLIKGGEEMLKVNMEKVEAEFVNDYKSVQAERESAITQAESDANSEVQNTAEYAELLSKQEQERTELVAKYTADRKAKVAALYDTKLAIYEKYVEKVEEPTYENNEEE